MVPPKGARHFQFEFEILEFPPLFVYEDCVNNNKTSSFALIIKSDVYESIHKNMTTLQKRDW